MKSFGALSGTYLVFKFLELRPGVQANLNYYVKGNFRRKNVMQILSAFLEKRYIKI